MIGAMIESAEPPTARRLPGRLVEDPDRLLSFEEFGEWAGGVTERTVRRWVAAPGGPAVLAIGGLRRIRARDALAWLETRYVVRESA